jgi:two-component system cell cycle response regulator DivK
MSAPPIVLLVEDNPRNVKLARDVLEYAGFVVVVATTGEEGVEQSRTAQPDVILMDLQLPGIDGYAALELIRAHGETAHIPVVALTAFAMRSDRERVLTAGFAGYLEKPISVREFPAQVRRHLPRDDDRLRS